MKKQFYLVRGIVRFKNKYLLLKKAKDQVTENIGKWECAGGKIEENEDPRETILREIKEETSLEGKIIKELPIRSKENKEYKSLCHVFLIEVNSEHVRISKEHESYKWVKPEDVKNYSLVLFADLLLEYFDNPERYLN